MITDVLADVKRQTIAKFEAAGISRGELARRMAVSEGEVRRLLNPDRGTQSAMLVKALDVLGWRIAKVVIEPKPATTRKPVSRRRRSAGG